MASEDFLQNQELIRHLEKEQQIHLVERYLGDGEDLILDHASCILFFNANEVPCGDEEQTLRDRISFVTSRYERCWVILQIDPRTDKYVLQNTKHLYTLTETMHQCFNICTRWHVTERKQP
jgi:hypothetical protein